MHSLLTHLQDKQDGSRRGKQVAKITTQLKYLPGFLHIRLIPHYHSPEEYTVITFWASRTYAHANRKDLDKIFNTQ